MLLLLNLDVPREIITKANALIQASYRLSLTEIQVLLYGVSLINPRAKDFPVKFVIDVKNFSKLFGKPLQNCYTELKESVVNKFWERDFSYLLDDDKIKKKRWLIDVTYGDKQGYLELQFHPDAKLYLYQLSKNFTVYYIDQITKFRGIYSIRFYEFSVMEINKFNKQDCYFILSLHEIKDRLMLNGKYNRYCDFKLHVIKKAQSEINAYSDLNLEYEEIKLGRTVEKIKFIITRKNGAKRAKYKAQEQLNHEPAAGQKPVLPSEEEITMMMYRNELRGQLLRYGITEKVASNLVEDYETARIEHALTLVKKAIEKGNINNPAAYLVSAIKEEYNA